MCLLALHAVVFVPCSMHCFGSSAVHMCQGQRSMLHPAIPWPGQGAGTPRFKQTEHIQYTAQCVEDCVRVWTAPALCHEQLLPTVIAACRGEWDAWRGHRLGGAGLDTGAAAPPAELVGGPGEGLLGLRAPGAAGAALGPLGPSPPVERGWAGALLPVLVEAALLGEYRWYVRSMSAARTRSCSDSAFSCSSP